MSVRVRITILNAMFKSVWAKNSNDNIFYHFHSLPAATSALLSSIWILIFVRLFLFQYWCHIDTAAWEKEKIFPFDGLTVLSCSFHSFLSSSFLPAWTLATFMLAIALKGGGKQHTALYVCVRISLLLFLRTEPLQIYAGAIPQAHSNVTEFKYANVQLLCSYTHTAQSKCAQCLYWFQNILDCYIVRLRSCLCAHARF